MNFTHVHLLLNHIPTVAFSIGIGLFIVALVQNNRELQRVCLVIFFLTAALSIVTYVTGNDARFAIQDLPDAPMALIDAHESAAIVALTLMQVMGFFAWIGLWMWRQSSRLPNWNAAVILILAIATFGLMARAANIGGEIRHPEIQDEAKHEGQDADAAPSGPRSWGMYVEAHSWVWPTAETLHFVGLCLLFGVVLTVDLRMLGVGKSHSFASLYQFLPLGMLGFTMNLLTGMLFFVATPQQYTGFLFFLKMVLVVFGAINVLYFMVFEGPWKVEEGVDAPAGIKLVAVSAIVIWIAVLFCGHMLPFLGNSF
jgi:uncharacterized membrane protein